jgi:hypothetical protein
MIIVGLFKHEVLIESAAAKATTPFLDHYAEELANTKCASWRGRGFSIKRIPCAAEIEVGTAQPTIKDIYDRWEKVYNT